MERLKVFSHLIYEYKKGIRDTALCTLTMECREQAINKLKTNKIAYFICPINDERFNIFFGSKVCIDVIGSICDKPLNQLSPKEDFMLGTILGYGICEQCKRYSKKNKLKDMSVDNKTYIRDYTLAVV